MRVGIVGAGSIVHGFLPAQRRVEGLSVKAICGLEADRTQMEALAAEYGIETVCYDYEEMVKREDLDVIYVALPNVLHHRFGRRALEHGKHVIMEKPFAMNRAEAEDLIRLAEGKGLFLFDAVSNQYTPAYARLKKELPGLGDLKLVDINYSVSSRRYTALKSGERLYPVFDRRQGGGVMRDMGVYALYFLVGLFGTPERIHYYANMEAGVDTSGVTVLEYPGFLCSVTAAKDSYGDTAVSIQGDKGYISSSSPVNHFNPFRVREYTVYHLDREEEFCLNQAEEPLYYELEAFVRMVESRDFSYRDERLAMTVTVMELMEEALGQVGMGTAGTGVQTKRTDTETKEADAAGVAAEE